MFLGVGGFAPLQIPNLKTTATADEGDLAFQAQFLAKIVGQEEAALFVGRAVLGLGMKLTQIDARVARRDPGDIFRRRADPLEFVRRHDEQTLPIGIGDEEELIDRAVAPPTRGDGDAMFIIDLVTKFAGKEIWR